MEDNISNLKQGSLLQGAKYVIEKTLGQGGFGITYLGLQKGLNRMVVIKEFFMKEYCERDSGTSHVTAGSQGSKDIVESFRVNFVKQAQTIAQLDNSHVIRIYDIFRENGTAYYVMEYIEGESLEEYVNKRQRLDETSAVKFVGQIADALSYIHAKNILHLDVTPSNVLLRKSGEAVLRGFDNSKRYDEQGEQSSTRPVSIRRGYSPIEQYTLGGVIHFNPSTDVYSLGAVLYKLLTGERPAEASALISGGPTIPPYVSSRCCSVIRKAMSLKKSDRYQSAAEMKAALNAEDVHEDVTILGIDDKMNGNESNLKQGSSLQDGKYVIEKTLGQGTFGITYQAEMKVQGKLGPLDFHVAIKEFFMKEKNERRSDGSVTCSQSSAETCEYYRKKFRHEAENLSKMKHGNIVKVSEIFDENNTSYYVMELVTGGSLDSYIDERHGLPEGEALRILREAGSAISFMHSKRMLHLDIKPNNIMRRYDGHIFLIDFGLSKQFNKNGKPESSTHVGLGTPGYAPHEQSGYKPDGSFPTTLDVYALGATLYKMLTGSKPPYPSDIIDYGLDKHPLEQKNVSKTTIAVIEKAMEPKKAERYQTVAEMLSALPVIKGKGKEEEPEVIDMSEEDTPKTKDWKKDDENKKKFKTYAIGAMALVIILVAAFLLFHKSENLVTSNIVQANSIVDEAPLTEQLSSSTKPLTGTINGHEYVDLGLSVKWATCNVGASSPTEYGNYYAWGETSPKSEYTEDNSETDGKSMGDISGNSTYDAARANWGGSWRLPTKAECQELLDNCKSEWTTQDGVKGRKFTSNKNGKSIFLPAAGWRGSSLFSAGQRGEYWPGSGYYWSGSHCVKKYAYAFHFDSSNYDMYYHSRSYGYSVRPVSG